ncbi:MAG: hypothetical protein Q4D80_01585 [Pseudomonadota bacterium]|nr:hypothetical protein [Pseudomonadota bacterium]
MNRRCLIQIGCTLICFFIYLTPAASRTCFLPDSEDCGQGDGGVSDISDVGSCRYYTCKDAGYKNDNPYQECYVENTVNIKNNKVSCYAVRCKMSQTACEEKAEGTNKCCNRDVASGCYYVGTCPKDCDRSIYSYDSEQTGDGWTCISCHDGKGTFYKCNYDKTCEEQGYATSCSDEQIAEEVTGAKGQNGEKCYTCKGKPLSCPDGYSTTVKTCATGYKLETNGAIEGAACGKCVEEGCPSGYATSTTSCPSGYTLETNGKSGSKTCGKCVANPDVPPATKGDLYIYVEKEGMCHHGIYLEEGNGITLVNKDSNLYKISFGSTANIKYTSVDETIYSNNKIVSDCEFSNWELSDLNLQFVQNNFTYDDNMYNSLRKIDADKKCVAGSLDCPETLNIYDTQCDGPCRNSVEIASISATRAIPYVMGVRTGGGDEYTEKMNSRYEFYIIYEPEKNITQLNATAYKCHMGNDGSYRTNLPSIDYNYIGFMNNTPYLVGKAIRKGSSDVFNDIYYTAEDGADRSSLSDIIIRDDTFGVYDNQVYYDTISNNYYSEHIVYCEPFKLENGKYGLYTLDTTSTDFIDISANKLALAFWETTGNLYPDTYLKVKRNIITGQPNKTKFEYNFVGNNFKNNSTCKISCGDKNWNESINNGKGVEIKYSAGRTGTIEADYVVGANLEPKALLPTGCTCHCTGGYTCIIE